MKTIALAGNPNCGKTALFNALTDGDAPVGNWPGITVERREGYSKGKRGERLRWIDLPGAYSLSPYTPEEGVTREYLLRESPDLIINLADAGIPERSLYFTLQLLELDIPVILVWNMEELAEEKGIFIDKERLSRLLGIPVMGVSAFTGRGMEELLQRAEEEASSLRKGRIAWSREALPKELSALAEKLEREGQSHSLFYAMRFLEETSAGEGDWETFFAAGRYAYAERCAEESGKKPCPPKQDRLFLHSLFGIPLFLLIMLAVFHLTFSASFLGTGLPSPGLFLRQEMGKALELVSTKLLSGLPPCFFKAFLEEGIFGGLGTAISFLPQMLCLFFFLDLLEDSGYMARAAFLLDYPMGKAGLSGRAFLPLLTGFGCSVPALFSARTLETERMRCITRLVIPFFSCGAKLPLYGLLTAAFFPKNGEWIVALLYLLGIAIAIITAVLLKRLTGKGAERPFVMEIPDYHWPRAKNLLRSMKRHSRDYLEKAATVILAASAGVWLLSRMSFSLELAEGGESILAAVGRWLSPFFMPLGFGGGESGWKAAAALLSGLFAKEAAVSAMGALGGWQGIFTPASAFSFLVFYLLYLPCAAAMGAYFSEERNPLWRRAAPFFWLGTAWLAAFLFYRIGLFLGGFAFFCGL